MVQHGLQIAFMHCLQTGSFSPRERLCIVHVSSVGSRRTGDGDFICGRKMYVDLVNPRSSEGRGIWCLVGWHKGVDTVGHKFHEM